MTIFGNLFSIFNFDFFGSDKNDISDKNVFVFESHSVNNIDDINDKNVFANLFVNDFDNDNDNDFANDFVNTKVNNSRNDNREYTTKRIKKPKLRTKLI